MKPQIFGLTVLIFVILTFTFFVSAQTEREKGMELYKQGKDSEAIDSLNTALKTSKNDAEVLNYLGLAYLNIDKFKDGRKSLERAVKLTPQSSTYRANLAYAHLLERKINKAQSEIEEAIRLDSGNANAYFIRATTYLWEGKFDKTVSDADRAIQINKDFTDAYVLKSDGLLYTFGQKWREENEPVESTHLLQNAVEVLKNCSGNCLNERGAKLIQEKLETVEAFLDYFNRKKDENPKIEASAEKTPIKFLNKPDPSYTDAARRYNEKGIVILAILFGADAKIKHIMVLQGLRYGLTEQAIKAARNMKFEPEIRSGKPVSKIMRVHYTFRIG